jgi:hypothetical protein
MTMENHRDEPLRAPDDRELEREDYDLGVTLGVRWGNDANPDKVAAVATVSEFLDPSNAAKGEAAFLAGRPWWDESLAGRTTLGLLAFALRGDAAMVEFLRGFADDFLEGFVRGVAIIQERERTRAVKCNAQSARLSRPRLSQNHGASIMEDINTPAFKLGNRLGWYWIKARRHNQHALAGLRDARDKIAAYRAKHGGKLPALTGYRVIEAVGEDPISDVLDVLSREGLFGFVCAVAEYEKASRGNIGVWLKETRRGAGKSTAAELVKATSLTDVPSDSRDANGSR